MYGVIINIRNWLFDIRILKSKDFDVRVIAVGNLSVGGTGKTPHIEYLVQLLKEDYRIAVLSRGYGRKTTGYQLATNDSVAKTIGDEPTQIKQKFKDEIIVAVDENRVNGINKIMQLPTPPEVVLLDDAYQHRYVKPSVNILLTPYNNLYINDYMMPTGRLREFKSGYKRADYIIVTKTPYPMHPLERRMLKERLLLQPYQNIFFTYYKYGDLKPIYAQNKEKKTFDNTYEVVLLTGIADTIVINEYVKSIANKVHHIEFSDHHNYSLSDIKRVVATFKAIGNEKKYIITTEKDATRLRTEQIEKLLIDIPIFYLPIEVAFHNNEDEFKKQIIKHVRNNKIDSEVYKRQN